MYKSRNGRTGSVEDEGGSSLANRYLSLSLFVMLLAFFIVLNAISQYEEEKVQTVVESLEGAFASNIVRQFDLKPSVTEAPEHHVKEGNTLEELEALFRSRIPRNRVVKSDLTGTMHIYLKWDDLEKAVMELGQGNVKGNAEENKDKPQKDSDTVFFLPALIALVRSDQTKAPFHMDILLNIEDKPGRLQNQKPQELARIMKRVTFVTARLEQAGLPAKLMSGGLKKGRGGVVELFFRRHMPFNPLGTDSQPEGDYIEGEDSGTEIVE